MAPKYIVLIVLVFANYPLYRLLLRFLFKNVTPLPGTPRRKTESTAPAADGDAEKTGNPGLGQLFDPIYLKDSGGETKLLLLLFAAALAILVEYLVIIGIFPALRGMASF